jgi:predicted ATPase/DNA-binding XRE family transcriptional regulator
VEREGLEARPKPTVRGTNTGPAATFGATLREIREARGLTQEELASRAGLTAKAVSALERGERKRPYPHTVRSLADALNLSDAERASLLAAVPGRGGAATATPDTAVIPILPVSLTPLVGRKQEVEEISGLLGQEMVRLLTLTGAGGVGKTRLALEVASEAGSGFPDGVASVALAPVADPALFVSTVAQALGLQEARGRSARELVHGYLRDKRLLLVLDNLEHLLEAAPEIAALLASCPRLKVLATSRAPLRLRGEREYPVRPLSVPNPAQPPDVESVAASPAAELFVRRAQEANPGFDLSRQNAAAVAAICWRLDGLPLALELTATRMRFLGPTDLLSRLDRALEAGGARDLPERQGTMRATLDWSYDLLSEEEKALFRRLSVFSGGWTLEAAEAVGARDDTSKEEVLGLLGSLVEQSLVVAEASPGEMRYRMLEPVRQYAREKLQEGGEAGSVCRAHAAFFLDLAERAYPELRGPCQAEWFEQLDLENDNLRAAIFWALSVGEAPQAAARLGWSLWQFWWLRGYRDEGRRWMEATLEHALPPALRARAANVAGAMAYTQGDYEASEEFCKESLDSALRAKDVLLEGYSWVGLGHTALSRGDFGAAASYLKKALPLFDRTREEHQSSMARVSLGTALLIQGDAGSATPMFEEGLTIARRIGDKINSCIALYNLAQVGLARGDHSGAASRLEEGVALSKQMRDQANLAYFLEALAVVAGECGEAERSARLFGAAEGLFEAVGAPVYSFYLPDRYLYERTADAVRSALGEPVFGEARSEGRAMTFEQAVEYALGGGER